LTRILTSTMPSSSLLTPSQSARSGGWISGDARGSRASDTGGLRDGGPRRTAVLQRYCCLTSDRRSAEDRGVDRTGDGRTGQTSDGTPSPLSDRAMTLRWTSSVPAAITPLAPRRRRPRRRR
jgi:hypothetical protein